METCLQIEVKKDGEMDEQFLYYFSYWIVKEKFCKDSFSDYDYDNLNQGIGNIVTP